MHTVSTIEAGNRKDASFASQAQAMGMIEEFISRVANHSSWEVRYTGPDRSFVFTSAEWNALEGERQQAIRDDPLWDDRVRFWRGQRVSTDSELFNVERGADTLGSFDDDADDPDSEALSIDDDGA